MFEKTPGRTPSLLWKILPLAVVVFGALVWVVSRVGDSADRDLQPLTGVLKAGDSDFDWYSGHLRLGDQKIKLGKNFAGHRMVMCSGVVENVGDRTLDIIEIKVTLFNYDEPIMEKLATPIRPGPRTPPLRSQEQRGFQFYVEDLPKNWLASRAEMELSGFRFKEQ